MKFVHHEALESRRLFNFAPFGQPGSVPVDGNVHTTDVAASRNGSYLVAVAAQLADANQISATRYNINGQRIGGGPLILYTSPNATTTAGQVSAAMDDDGDAVVAFVTSDGTATYQVNFVRISKTGVVSAPVVVDTLTDPDPDNNLAQLSFPSVSMGSAGSFMIGWTADITRSDNEARFRAYDAGGAPRGATFALNELFGSFTGAASMSLDVAPDGNSAAFAYVYGGTDYNISSVYFGRVNTIGLSGTIHGVDNPGDGPITDYGRPSIASFADGSFVLSYDRNTSQNSSDSGLSELFIERYNASSVRQGNPIAVGASLGEFNRESAIDTLPDGGFAVTYAMTRGDVYTLYAQRFSASGKSDSAGPVDLAAASSLDEGLYQDLDLASDGYGTTIVAFRQSHGSLGQTTVAEYRRATTQLAIVEGTTLYVAGTRSSDDISISAAPSGTLTVTNSILISGGTKKFGGSGIESINVDGFNGDDNITNNGNLPMVARGGSGNDLILGGANSATIGANDILRGNTGNDYIRGRSGHDLLLGDDGNDTIFGDEGNDVIEGGRGNDQLRGDQGTDSIDGNDGDDRLQGGPSDDTLYGGDGDDRLYGDDDNDYLDGGAGRDFVRGGNGHDWILGRDNNTIDNLIGDGGRDTVAADKVDVLSDIEVVR